VLAKGGVHVSMSDLFRVTGSARLLRVEMPTPYRARIRSLRQVMEALDFEIDMCQRSRNSRPSCSRNSAGGGSVVMFYPAASCGGCAPCLGRLFGR
jgi:hypothetical protein